MDVALYKQTYISSNFSWFYKRFSSPTFAVNGLNNSQNVNVNGIPFFEICSTTQQDVSPGWWMVDLGATYHITSITIWGPSYDGG